MTPHAINGPLADVVTRVGALQAEPDEMGAGRPKASRGTSNGNSSGSAEDRRRRKVWLLDTYRANVDVLPYHEGAEVLWEEVAQGLGVKACRCYRCGKLLTMELITVDRIIPGCLGGTYRRDNIRPACKTCNESTGGKLAHVRKPKRKRAPARKVIPY